jgi:hypothetical protein
MNTESKTHVVQLLGVVLLSATLAGGALGKSGGASGHSGCVSVPFKGSSSGIGTATGFDPVAGIAYSHGEAQGRATHVGRFTVTNDVAVEVATGFAQGTWTITAANGDQLFLDMTGYGIDDRHGAGQFTITGGTGRFEGASGYYDQIITFAVPLGSADVIANTDVFVGTLSLCNE